MWRGWHPLPVLNADDHRVVEYVVWRLGTHHLDGVPDHPLDRWVWVAHALHDWQSSRAISLPPSVTEPGGDGYGPAMTDTQPEPQPQPQPQQPQPQPDQPQPERDAPNATVNVTVERD